MTVEELRAKGVTKIRHEPWNRFAYLELTNEPWIKLFDAPSQTAMGIDVGSQELPMRAIVKFDDWEEWKPDVSRRS